MPRAINLSISEMMSSMCPVARGVCCGRLQPSASKSLKNSASYLAVYSSRELPDSRTRLMILSSTSVMFITWVRM